MNVRCSDHAPVQMIKATDKEIRSVSNKFTNSMWSEEELPEEWEESIILTVYKKGVVNSYLKDQLVHNYFKTSQTH